jgi:hypothetical protein
VEGATGSPFDAVQKVKLFVVRVGDALPWERQVFPFGDRGDEVRGDENQQFFFEALMRRVAKEWPDVWQITETGNS